MADCSCTSSSLYASTEAARLEAITRAKAEVEAEEAKLEKLKELRNQIKLRDAVEQARFVALKESETAYKIRERDTLEKQLQEQFAIQKRMQDQYQEFITTTEEISNILAHPERLFKKSTVCEVQTHEDYFKLVYQDGRVVVLPFAVVDIINQYASKATKNAILKALEETIEDLKAKDKELGKSIAKTDYSLVELTRLFNAFADDTNKKIAKLDRRYEEFEKHVEEQVKDLKEEDTRIDGHLKDTNKELFVLTQNFSDFKREADTRIDALEEKDPIHTKAIEANEKSIDDLAAIVRGLSDKFTVSQRNQDELFDNYRNATDNTIALLVDQIALLAKELERQDIQVVYLTDKLTKYTSGE